jgi:hypothetical protein
MRVLIHWFATNPNLLAIIVTAGVAVLLACCIECTKCTGRQKDDVIHRHEA